MSAAFSWKAPERASHAKTKERQILKSLVLILGAGASKEVNLPIGSELKIIISSLLDIRFPGGYTQEGGDYAITQALRLLAEQESEKPRDINPYLRMCWRIRDAMPQAISIDNFIDSHSNEPKIAICGKLAIARAILSAEASSTLAFDRSNSYNKFRFESTTNTWFNSFFQLLTENCRIEDLPARLKKVGVITFNYDRCFEHYLFHALQNYFGIDFEKAADLMKNLVIYHPYGLVGSLPWTKAQSSIEFGFDVPPSNLLAVAKQLRTFTEGTDPSLSDINAVRSLVSGSSRLAFLGFAFHRLNLDLLFGSAGEVSQNPMQAIYASALGISQSDTVAISREIVSFTRLNPAQIYLRNGLTCDGIFKEFWRSLSLG